jgi:hypothetical protein
VRSWTASASVYALTLTPPVTVAISVLLGRESVTPELLIGGVLVMLGVYVGAVIGVRHESVARKVEAAPGVASACRDAELRASA